MINSEETQIVEQQIDTEEITSNIVRVVETDNSNARVDANDVKESEEVVLPPKLEESPTILLNSINSQPTEERQLKRRTTIINDISDDDSACDEKPQEIVKQATLDKGVMESLVTQTNYTQPQYLKSTLPFNNRHVMRLIDHQQSVVGGYASVCIFGDTETEHFSISSDGTLEIMQKEIDYQMAASPAILTLPKVSPDYSRLKDLIPGEMQYHIEIAQDAEPGLFVQPPCFEEACAQKCEVCGRDTTDYYKQYSDEIPEKYDTVQYCCD